jgi:hypothetical protein
VNRQRDPRRNYDEKTDRRRYGNSKDDCLIRLRSGFVCLAETVARVGDCKPAVHLSGDLDQVSGRMCRRGAADPARSLRLPLRRENVGNRRAVIDVRDEYCGSVVESDVVRPVQLPEILKARRLCRTRNTSGVPPLRVPLFITAPRGCNA